MKIDEIKRNLTGDQALIITKMLSPVLVSIIITDDIAAIAGDGLTIQVLPIEGYAQFMVESPSGTITVLNSIPEQIRNAKTLNTYDDSIIEFLDEKFIITRHPLNKDIRENYVFDYIDISSGEPVLKMYYIEYIPNADPNTKGTVKLYS